MDSEALANLSISEIQARLLHVDSDRAALQRALRQRRQQTRNVVAREVKDLILSKGHDVSDILALISSKKTGTGNRNYTHYVDPHNPENEYIRGVVPRWMREQMRSHGLDPKKRIDREIFKERWLQKKMVNG